MNAVLMALGWTVLHALWQVLAIAAAAWAIGACVRSPAARCRIYSGALALMILVPGLTFARYANGMGNAQAAHSLTAAATVAAPEAPAIDRVSLEIKPGPGFHVVVSDRIAQLCGWAWVAGVLLMGARTALGALRIRKLRLEADAFPDSQLQEKVRAWAAELGITKVVRLCVTRLNEAPAVIGHFKPLILIPAATVARLTPQQLEAVIIHELAHIRRNDFLVNALQSICETALFFHPAAWWLSAAIRHERELCCDDAASQRGGSISYAKALVALEEARAGSLQIAATGGSLKKRIARLLAGEKRSSATWLGPVFSALLLVLGLAFVAPNFAAEAVPTNSSSFQIRAVAEETQKRPADIIPFARPRPGGEKELPVWKESLMDSRHVASATLEKDPLSKQDQIKVTLTKEGGALFAKVTKDSVGKRLAIIVNNKILMAPVIAQEIAGGELVISGNFTGDEAKEIAKSLAPEKK